MFGNFVRLVLDLADCITWAVVSFPVLSWQTNNLKTFWRHPEISKLRDGNSQKWVLLSFSSCHAPSDLKAGKTRCQEIRFWVDSLRLSWLWGHTSSKTSFIVDQQIRSQESSAGENNSKSYWPGFKSKYLTRGRKRKRTVMRHVWKIIKFVNKVDCCIASYR